MYHSRKIIILLYELLKNVLSQVQANNKVNNVDYCMAANCWKNDEMKKIFIDKFIFC